MDNNKKTIYTPEEVIDLYDNQILQSIDIIDYRETFQSLRTKNIEDLHEYIIQSAGLKNGQYILDAGCGICGPSIYFALNLDVKIEALNMSRKQIEHCKRHISESGLSNKINPVQGDYHLIEKYFKPFSFDVVLFLESFVHSAQPEKLLKAVWNVLKPGGTLYIKDPFIAESDNTVDRKRIQKAIDWSNQIWLCYQKTKAEMNEYIINQGFKLIWNKIPDFETDDFKIAKQYDEFSSIDYFRGDKPIDFAVVREVKAEKPSGFGRKNK